MDDFERELKQGFLDEAAQGLSEVEQSFLLLEQNPEDQEVISKIFRLAHNLKGSSRAVGFEAMGAFTHEFESLLLKIKNGEMKASPQVINLMLRCTDHLVEMVEVLKSDFNANIDSAGLLAEIKAAMEAVSVHTELPASKDEPSPAHVDQQPVGESSGETEITLEELELLNDIRNRDLNVLLSGDESHQGPSVQDAKSENESPVSFQIPAKEAHNSVKEKTPTPARVETTEESIRVSLSRVERLQNYIGELVINQSVVLEQAQKSGIAPLIRTVSQMSKVIKELQDISMGLRMVPVRSSFQKMQRIVRDTSAATGKSVRLITEGEETELDKTLLERLNDPLVHLVRNAVDHGIESAEERLSCGKPAEGQVRLAAYHRGGKICIDIQDDGKGLDAEKLRNKAIEKGLISPSARLSERECWNLIFLPGFSTKEQTTEISGRGVGMDVVKTNITALGGHVEIESEKGKGSLFRLSLPLTLSIIDGMIIRCDNQRHIVPLGQIHESVRVVEGMVEDLNGVGEVLKLRGEVIPLSRTRRLL
ncbi:MAG: chemotaxis protein CheA, partial [Bdellovibrionaceae bacterium]|nr:chemotaxis protein CheA [Pseudobdellovibrionaceae bacterium]